MFLRAAIALAMLAVAGNGAAQASLKRFVTVSEGRLFCCGSGV